ncbi:MAG TPA: SDR family oxidoreductase [Acetobacteraceae bacterium]|jgi:NAD(P)-dependent dehydrogenase (short-subunit alcohol dehydrogenase family)|nr:SDR family oxidoreductase [Acetobacteraceae bacterium]
MTDYRTATYRSLAGRGVLISGGASGLGAEMVRAFAQQGARVVFFDIDDAAAGELVERAEGAVYRHCDLRDIAALRAAVAEADELVEIDVLINNAARDDRHDFFSVEPEDWNRYLDVNLHHQFFATQAAARLMRQRRRGSIILMGSISWMRARPGLVAYTTAKAGIHGLTRTLSRELGEYGIRVNSIVPGAISTERQQKLWRSPEIDARIMEGQALKISLDGSHVARMALFVGSDESAGRTGTNFIVDAGLTQN